MDNQSIDSKVDESFARFLSNAGSSIFLPSFADSPEYSAMLAHLSDWADRHALGKWKRSRIMGQIEINFRSMGVSGPQLTKLNRMAADAVWDKKSGTPASGVDSGEGTGCLPYILFFGLGWLLMAAISN